MLIRLLFTTRVATPSPDIDNRSLKAKLASEMSQATHKIIQAYMQAYMQALVLWAWQAYPGIVHVPQRAWSEYAKSQLHYCRSNFTIMKRTVQSRGR